ncbi:conjugative transposon protein TraK [Zhouia sp. PK063]|uniref:conjugative transposon protein TraK n=1 Tax=Zhouia sp. PK063 TaxID=3373602 RepID=UPI0037902865
MFEKAQHLDTAFKQVRLVAILIISVYTLICILVCSLSFRAVSRMQDKIYVLANNKAIEAFAVNTKDNIPVEAKDHIKTFHQLFFHLEPDDKVIQEHISRSLYLADHSVKSIYDNLKEQGYYTQIIAGNISQEIQIDSIALQFNSYPYYFKAYGKEKLIRPTSELTRSLITEGYLRNTSRSEYNSHGFLIEHFKIIANKDLKVHNRAHLLP